MQQLSLISIALPKQFTRETIEEALGYPLQRGIEKAFYAQRQERYIVFTQFNVLTFINHSQESIRQTLHTLHLKHAANYEAFYLFQDYPIRLDPTLEVTCSINNDYILLKTPSPLSFLIIALVVSQSVGLEKHEKDLEDHFAHSRQLIDMSSSFSPLKRGELTHFASELTLVQYGMVSDLFLLDKPNILWENEDAENLYNELSSMLELKDRFEIVAYKLKGLKDDIDMVIDLSNHKHSEVLDWIVIVFIAIAIAIMVLEFFLF